MLRCTSNVANCAPFWRRRLTMMLVLCLLSWERLVLPWAPRPGRRAFLRRRKACRR